MTHVVRPSRRQPGRFRLARRRRVARRAELYIANYRFPAHIAKRVRRHHPNLDDEDWKLVDQGLREWFICCAWRGRTVLGMPSRLVDDAWHEFILDSFSYINFCEVAFGGYLHHAPDETMGTPMPEALAETVRAWDRSAMGAGKESVLWDLDTRLGVGEPLGIDIDRLHAARTRVPYMAASGWACGAGVMGMADGGSSGGEGCSSSGCSSSGCSGGGGCGGGGS